MEHITITSETNLDDMKKVGDLVAAFFVKWFDKSITDFYAKKEYLDLTLRNNENDEGWLHKIIKEKFGIDKLSFYGFSWEGKDLYAKNLGGELAKRYANAKTFSVEKMRQFLNKKYAKHEIMD